MGRPLNKKHFGETSTTEEIKVRFFDGTVKTGWIEKQVGSKRFKISDGSFTGVGRLVAHAPAADTFSNNDVEMAIVVEDAAGAEWYVTKISGRKVTVLKADDALESMRWSFEDAAGAVVEMEDAGQDTFTNPTEVDND